MRPGQPRLDLLAAALSPRADPDLLFTAVCDELATPPSPALLVIEDAHWADGATLDVLRYLGTRVQNLPAALLITYRDDALARDHPLRGVLGALGSTAATRLRLTRLTSDAVREMAVSTNVDPSELFRLTGGNPFFVSEVLANPGAVVPPTVVDAVLARVGTLSPPAQAALDRLAVIPSGVEVDLLRTLVDDLAPVAEAEAERAGVVEVRGDVVAFRHELARRAVVESLPASTRLERNADVLRALLTRSDCDPFRVLHHAVDRRRRCRHQARPDGGAGGRARRRAPASRGLLRPGAGPGTPADDGPAGCSRRGVRVGAVEQQPVAFRGGCGRDGRRSLAAGRR